MFEFEWPWVGLAILLPLIARLLPRKPQPLGSALRVADISAYVYNDKSQTTSRTNAIRWIIALLAYATLTLAAMRPVLVGEQIDIPLEGRDLMMAIDISGSMREDDMRLNGRLISRIGATKRVAIDFIEKRIGDHLGLIVFAAYPYLQTPLTFDRKSLIENIAKAQLGDADDLRNNIQGTSIGDAIGLAVKRLRETDTDDKTLILLTDGEDTASKVPPIKAAELAAKNGLKIYTIGIGANRRSFFDFGGSGLDEKTLKEVAKLTDGKYFRARNAEELNEIYRLIDQLEPIESDNMSFKPRQTLFYYPLAISLLLTALLLLTRPVKQWIEEQL